MDLWKEGNLDDILLEGRCIQRHLPRPGKGRGKTQPLAKTFQKLMSSGKVNKALRCLSRNLSGGVLAMDDFIQDSSNGSTHRTTRDILVEKYPPGKPAQPNYLLQDVPVPTNNILFENLTAELILKVAYED